MKVQLSRDQVKSIFGFHPSLRFVTVVSKDGTLLDAVKRAGLDSLEPQAETKKIQERWAIARSMTAGSDEYFGRMKTIVVRREKLVEMLFPASDYTVIISAHPSFPLGKIPQLESLLNNLRAEGD